MVILAVAAVMLLPLAASAMIYDFEKITNNGNPDVSKQLWVNVTEAGDNVKFQFYNTVGTTSSITDIYFDDGTLLGIASITDSGVGVVFDTPATPGDLPGRNLASPQFETTANFSVDSNNPIMANGVNTASEWVAITFSLINGKTYADTLFALDSGDLRIGLHVQAIGLQGGSDSYINNPEGGVVPPVPLPAAFWLIGAGLVRLGFYSRRRRQS
jgi:hypothetical protein